MRGGYRSRRRVDGVPGPRFAGRAALCAALSCSQQTARRASDGAQDCSQRSRALVLVLGDRLLVPTHRWGLSELEQRRGAVLASVFNAASFAKPELETAKS